MVVKPVPVLLCILLLVGAFGPVVGASTVTGGTSLAGDLVPSEAPAATSIVLAGLQTAPGTDNTVTRIVLFPNGTATWTLQIRTRLETDEEVAEYEAFQERFRENVSTYRGAFAESIDGIVGNARAVTGREMDADAFTAETSIQTVPRRWGIVTYEFRWSGFAATEGDRLVVGDVFEGGLFIAEGDTLSVVAPEGYEIESVDPAPDDADDGVATWQGREDFADGRPRIVAAPASVDAAAGSSGIPTDLGVAAVVAILAIAVVGLWRWRRGGGGTVLGSSGAGAASAGGDSAGSTTDDETLLADEDYVRRVLSENGGRVKQKDIVESLGWSTSKTSRVLGRMEEEGAIRKLQLGRENVIALPDEDAEKAP